MSLSIASIVIDVLVRPSAVGRYTCWQITIPTAYLELILNVSDWKAIICLLVFCNINKMKSNMFYGNFVLARI